MISTRGHATHVMIKTICDDTYNRIKQWFSEHPAEPYCYWAKDEFISIADKDNKDILDRHPEIEDINDHTIVQLNDTADIVKLSRFCPRLKEGLSDMFDNDIISGTSDNTRWALLKDRDNFEIIICKK